MQLLIEFGDFPEEQNLIGKMLMAYGEFEFYVSGMVGRALGNSDLGGRVFFRVHGEAARLDVSDAILRPHFTKQNLAGQWGNTIGALRYCKNVRNQYAHCNWSSSKGNPLTFFNMDVDAASPDGTLMLTTHPIDLTLLKSQHAYFEYCNDWLYYFSCKQRLFLGEETRNPPAPKSIPQPPLSNRPKKPPELPIDDKTPSALPAEDEKPESSSHS